jgi:hypothetical protein
MGTTASLKFVLVEDLPRIDRCVPSNRDRAGSFSIVNSHDGIFRLKIVFGLIISADGFLLALSYAFEQPFFPYERHQIHLCFLKMTYVRICNS